MTPEQLLAAFADFLENDANPGGPWGNHELAHREAARLIRDFLASLS
jgi:hypothetical protein